MLVPSINLTMFKKKDQNETFLKVKWPIWKTKVKIKGPNWSLCHYFFSFYLCGVATMCWYFYSAFLALIKIGCGVAFWGYLSTKHSTLLPLTCKTLSATAEISIRLYGEKETQLRRNSLYYLNKRVFVSSINKYRWVLVVVLHLFPTIAYIYYLYWHHWWIGFYFPLFWQNWRTVFLDNSYIY